MACLVKGEECFVASASFTSKLERALDLESACETEVRTVERN